MLYHFFENISELKLKINKVNIMNKTKLLTTAFAAALFSISTAHAAGTAGAMEKCKVVDAQGKGLIKEHKSDCSGAKSSCAAQNKAGDPEAWILVPTGDCAKINKGDYTGISKEIMDKLDIPEAKK
jgi:uncharacterized membrane protein